MPRTSFVAPFASRETNTADTRPLLVNQNGFDAASIGNPPASLRHIGVVGLGLIGGSFAKAYADAGLQVYGADIDERSLAAATAEGSIVSALDDKTVGECDLILIALYPQATVDWLREMAPRISKDALVIDCGGVKRSICPDCFSLAERHGFTFLGGHPMAGTHRSGFRAARSDLYVGSPMVLVPPPIYDPSVIARAQEALSVVGFGSFSVTTPEMHDRLIAYTSQLAHIVSSAFIKSPTSQKHRGFSAGSYRRSDARCRDERAAM
ncbi:MAG: prephenate dehydrogenase [Slackia sp.]